MLQEIMNLEYPVQRKLMDKKFHQNFYDFVPILSNFEEEIELVR